jgi:hypothetical protein
MLWQMLRLERERTMRPPLRWIGLAVLALPIASLYRNGAIHPPT